MMDGTMTKRFVGCSIRAGERRIRQNKAQDQCIAALQLRDLSRHQQASSERENWTTCSSCFVLGPLRCLGGQRRAFRIGWVDYGVQKPPSTTDADVDIDIKPCFRN